MPASTPLFLDELTQGTPGITSVWGASLAEAASVSFEAQGHQSPKTCAILGFVNHEHAVSWSPIDDQTRRCWNDLQEAAEHGAYGIAALLIPKHTTYEVVERSRKGTGFDYWLGSKERANALFQHAARLEVSSIQKGDSTIVTARVRQKMEQTTRTDGTLPAFVIVVEYGSPIVQTDSK
jgi:hypothetical protein